VPDDGGQCGQLRRLPADGGRLPGSIDGTHVYSLAAQQGSRDWVVKAERQEVHVGADEQTQKLMAVLLGEDLVAGKRASVVIRQAVELDGAAHLLAGDQIGGERKRGLRPGGV